MSCLPECAGMPAHTCTHTYPCAHIHAHLGLYLHKHSRASRNVQTHSHVHDRAFTEASMCPQCTHMHVHTPASTMRAHLPTCACTGHTLCSYMYVCTHISTHMQSHTHTVCSHAGICVHTSFVYIQASSTQACLSTCAHTCLHTPPCAGTRVHTHTCARACGLAHPPSCRQAVSLVPQRGQLFQASGWLPPHRLASREPVCPCLPWTWGSITGPSPGWQLCPLYPECSPLPPKHEARDSSPGGLPALPSWRGAPFTGILCAPQGRTIIRPHLCHGLLRTGHVSVPLSVGRPASQLAVEACGRDGWSEGPGDLHPPQPHRMLVRSPVWVAVGRAQQHFTQSQTRPPQPVGPSCLHSVEVLDLSSCLSPHVLSGSPRTSCLPWPQFSHL